MKRSERIEKLLTDALKPAALEIIDESAMHAGHSGAAPGGETHYRVQVTAAVFEGLSRLDRQRTVYNILAKELDSGLHALSLKLSTPSERP